MAVARRVRGVERGGLCVAPGLHSPWARGWQGNGDQLGVKKQSQGQRVVKGCAPLISACSQGLCERPKLQVYAGQPVPLVSLPKNATCGTARV